MFPEVFAADAESANYFAAAAEENSAACNLVIAPALTTRRSKYA
jgi:hypothetical protein